MRNTSMGSVGIHLQLLTKALSSPLILLLSISLPPFGVHPSNATDSISWGESLTGNRTIVSSGGKFELGFFTPGNSHKYYIGIWYKKIPVRTVIWVANREVPVSSSESSVLKISNDGNLVLLNLSRIPIWSSNITFPKSNSTVAVILDTGNLVLKERPDSTTPIWQSFEHPTDTAVLGSRIGMNKITREYQILTSWKNSEDPAPGMFSHHIDPGGSSDYLTLWNGSVVYNHLGVWNGHSFLSFPQMRFSWYLEITFVETKEWKYINAIPSDDSILFRVVMDVSGQLKIFLWQEDDQSWMLITSRPEMQCDVFSVCGAFGICDNSNFHACSCLPGFEPRSLIDSKLNDWSGGCVRKSPLECMDNTSGLVDVFSVMPHVKLPTNSQTLSVADAEECRKACLHNCSCSAYTYDGACLIWSGQLLNVQQLSGAGGIGGTLHLRLAASERTHSSRKLLISAILGSSLGLLMLSSIALAVVIRISKRRALATMAKIADGSLFQFKYNMLQQITKKFSVQLGRGGFGSVFKGELPDSTPVAVKKLEGLRQGEKQFRAEVKTLGIIQHVNLVRLRGFCSEGEKRLLVYDYMPNGSLDFHLFRREPPCLDWSTRHQIALGTARGLAYLHEGCRQCIIHCDVKPENVLLDGSYIPKVADFGMAKLVGRDFSRVLTTMRGTIGYLAPEWISGLGITPKADVYSFGMMLFELISGRRNADMGDGMAAYFPFVVARKISEGGDVLCLLDQRLGGKADVEELTRACTAACWCLQDEECRRPTMGQVVRILEGILPVNVPPIPRSLLIFMESKDDTSLLSPIK